MQEESNSCIFSPTFNTITQRNSVRCMKIPQKLFYMQFLEKIQFICSSYKILNIFICFLFTIIFILNSISRIFLTNREIDSKFYPRDLLFYICALRPEVVHEKDLSLDAGIVSTFIIAVFFIYIIIITTKARYHAIDIHFFVVLMFYMTPITLIAAVHVFVQYLILANDDGLNSLMTFCLILHSILLWIYGFVYPLAAITPREIMHPFFTISSVHEAIFISYIILFAHLCGFYHRFNLFYFILRIIASFSISVYHLCSPFYTTRLMNSLFLFCTLSEFLSSCIYVSYFGDNYITVILLMLIPECAISFLVFFVIFPFVTKFDKIHSIKNAYISGQKERVISLLHHIKVEKINKYNMHEIVRAAVNLNYDRIEPLITQVLTKNVSTYLDFYYIWTTLNMLDVKNNKIPKVYDELIDKYIREIDSENKKFWSNVYLSNLSKLPYLASKLNASHVFQQFNLLFSSSICPKILESPKLDQQLKKQLIKRKKQSIWKRYFSKISLIEIYYVLVFIIVIIGHILIFWASELDARFIRNCKEFEDFFFCFTDYERAMWTGENSFSSLVNLSNNYEIFLELVNTSASLTDLLLDRISMNSKTNFIEQFSLLLNNLYTFHNGIDRSLTSSFPFNDIQLAILNFNESLTSMYDIFSNSAVFRTNVVKIYIIASTCSSLLILILGLISKVVFEKNQQNQFYKKFALIPKSDLDLYEEPAIKGSFQFRRKHNFSYFKANPATTISMAWEFLGQLVLFCLLYLSLFFSYENTKLIETMVKGVTAVEKVPLFFVSGILFNNSLYHENAILSLDIITQNAQIYEFNDLIPSALYDFYGLMFYENRSVTYTAWGTVYDIVKVNTIDKSLEYTFIRGFFTRRFAAFLLLTIILYIFSAYFQRKMVIFRQNEQSIGDRIWSKLGIKDISLIFRKQNRRNNSMKKNKKKRRSLFKKNNDDNDEVSLKKYFAKFNNYTDKTLPLNMINVNKNMEIVFATKQSKKKVGNKFKHIQLSLEIEKLIKKINKEHRPNEEETIEFSFEKDETFIVSPYLQFSKNNNFEVNLMTIIKIKDSPSQVNELESRYNFLFDYIYPSFLHDKEMPAQVTTAQNFLTILLIKIDGFHEYLSQRLMRAQLEKEKDNQLQIKLKNRPVSKSDPTFKLTQLSCANFNDIEGDPSLNQIVRSVRRKISNALFEITRDKPFIFKVRENLSEIIISFNQDSVAWKIVEYGADVARTIMSLINNITEIDNLSATALLYKSKVYDYYVSPERMALIDFHGDIIYKAEEIIDVCVPSHVNYVSVIPREMRAKFTAKYKHHVCRDGTNIDLYVFV